MSVAYDTDIVTWSADQARMLRAMGGGKALNLPLDWDNLAEEIEALGRSERHALRGHIGAVLEHLIKLMASPANDPRRGWVETIIRARADIADCLADSPSLDGSVDGLIEVQTMRARKLVAAVLETYGERPCVDLGGLEFSRDQVLGDWFPAD